MFVTFMLILILVACFASLFTAGLWSNLITTVNVIIAAMIATNYFEPVAAFFDRQEPHLTYVWDFMALWLLFGGAFTVLRMATDYMSPVKVRFFVPVEKVGGILFACWASWIVMCFATVTLHTAPLALHFLGDSFQPTPKEKMFYGLGPDRIWLGWIQRESKGSLARLGNTVPFDPKGDFIIRYGSRREAFDKQISFMTPKPAAGPGPAP